MTDKNIAHIAMSLFMLLFSVYLVTAPGYVYEADVSQLRMAVAASIVDRFDLTVTPDIGIQGADGRSYSWFGIGPVLAAVPFYIAGKFSGVSPANYVCLFNLVIGALTAVLVFIFTAYLGYSLRAAFLASLFYGLGTMAWYYSKDPGDHTIETFLILLTLYFGHRFGKECKASDLILSALFLGMALLTRPTSILIMPALICQLIPDHLNTCSLKRTAASAAKFIVLFIIVLIPFAGIYLWYNHYRFGNVFETGYGLIATRLGLDYFEGTQFLTGLRGFLISPGKGYFYYTPIAVLFFFSLKSFAQKHPKTAISFLMIVLSYLAFYSKYLYWHGCSGWGPRFIFAITPFLIIPTASLFDSVYWMNRKYIRGIVYTLFAVSMSVQIAAVSVIPFKYDMYLQIDQGIKYKVARGDGAQPILSPPVEIFFNWRESPIVAQFRFMHEIFSGLHSYKYNNDTRDISPVEVIKRERWMNLYDFWWFHKYFSQPSKSWFMPVAILLSVAMYYLRKILKLIM